MKIHTLAKIPAFALSAALLGLVSITPASAAPSAAGNAAVRTDGVTLVAQKTVVVKKRNGHVTRKVVYRNGFRPGGHYRRAPGGWHRFDNRPGDWNTRGCIVVGPIWYCP